MSGKEADEVGARRLKADLDALIRALEVRIDDARDAAEIEQINRLIREANRRSTRLGATVLAKETTAMLEARASITEAIPAIRDAIAENAALVRILRDVTAGLALVDKALDGAALPG